MKIINKILIIMAILALVTCFMQSSISLANWNGMGEVNKILSANSNSKAINSTKNIASTVITITQVIATGVAIIMLIVVAMKYMTAAPSDRASIKKHAIVYVVGAVVLFGATGILEIIEQFAEGVNKM